MVSCCDKSKQLLLKTVNFDLSLHSRSDFLTHLNYWTPDFLLRLPLFICRSRPTSGRPPSIWQAGSSECSVSLLLGRSPANTQLPIESHPFYIPYRLNRIVLYSSNAPCNYLLFSAWQQNSHVWYVHIGWIRGQTQPVCGSVFTVCHMFPVTWGEPNRSPPRDDVIIQDGMCSWGNRSPVGPSLPHPPPLLQCRNVISWLKLSEEELTAPARAENQKEKHLFDWASLFLRLKCCILKKFCLKTTSITDLILFSFDYQFFSVNVELPWSNFRDSLLVFV